MAESRTRSSHSGQFTNRPMAKSRETGFYAANTGSLIGRQVHSDLASRFDPFPARDERVVGESRHVYAFQSDLTGTYELVSYFQAAMEQALQASLAPALRNLEQSLSERLEMVEAAVLALADFSEREDSGYSDEEVRAQVSDFFAEHRGTAYDADDIAKLLDLPLSQVVDAMDALASGGAIKPL